MTFGEKVHKLRKQQNLTRQELAIRSGYQSLYSIYNIENNKTATGLSRACRVLAEALGVSPLDLISDEVIPE